MDRSLQFFSFKDQPVRVVMFDGKPNWVLADVCQVLELGNVSRVAARLKRDGVTTSKVTDSLGREQEALCVNEPNLYRVIFQSRKSEAVAFQDWVFEEVLPEIRKTGSYSLHQQRKELSNNEIVSNPEFALQTLEMHKSMRLAFYRSARDWQGVVNILYPGMKESRKKSNVQLPKILVYQGEELTQLMISFSEDIA